MKKHLQYLFYVLRHKWYVMIECFRIGLIWRGIIHDISKFLPSEWFPYADHFYGRKVRDSTGYYKPTNTGDPAFDFAWFLHQKRNRHHWQWWILPEDEGGVVILPMGELERAEMLCDWKGAGKAQGFKAPDDCRKWYEKNKGKMKLHDDTRNWIEGQLYRGGFDGQA